MSFNARLIRSACLLAGLAALTACGTTYNLPTASEAHEQAAASMFAEERDPGTARAGLSMGSAAQR